MLVITGHSPAVQCDVQAYPALGLCFAATYMLKCLRTATMAALLQGIRCSLNACKTLAKMKHHF